MKRKLVERKFLVIRDEKPKIGGKYLDVYATSTSFTASWFHVTCYAIGYIFQPLILVLAKITGKTVIVGYERYEEE